MTLEETIRQLVNLGEKDPMTIASQVIERNDKEWLAGELLALASDVIAEIARQVVGHQRRSAEVALAVGDQVASSELKLRSFWVPGAGYKRAADLTADDLKLRAALYDKLVVAASRRAAWLREVAGMMEREGAKTLGRLKAALPPLPAEEDVTALLPAAAVL